MLQDDIEDLDGDTLTNSAQDETFNHNAVQANWSWDINDRMQLKWIGGWSDFDYTFFDDNDRSTSGLSVYNQDGEAVAGELLSRGSAALGHR